MNSFTFKGVTYEVIPNGDHFTVVDEDKKWGVQL